ncbi:MAG: hypothetical protein JO301_00135 [Chitinophagaceae bacterium]|nr:hypothetical protein [Chitinophagaceae bacterium]
MKKYILALIGLLPLTLYAQQNGSPALGLSEFLYDNVGRPVPLRSDIELQGSPYFADKYCHATLKVRKGKTYHGLRVKVDLQSSAVIYMDETGKEMEAITPLDRIEFYDCEDASKNRILISGLPPVDKQNESSYYVLLDSGNISLLKYYQVSYNDRRNNYGNANIIRTYQQVEIYYSYTPGKGLARLSKDNAAVLDALAEKKKEVGDYIAANNIKCRRESDLVKVFAYYNSLK